LKALVQALQAGEDQTLNILMDRHREGLFRFVLRLVHNEADALELAAETFVRAYFRIGKFQPTAKFATWLYHIALNLCRDHVRSRAYQYSLQTVSFDAPVEDDKDPTLLQTSEGWPDQNTERREELAALEKAIAELPEDLKTAFVLTDQSLETSTPPGCFCDWLAVDVWSGGGTPPNVKEPESQLV